MASKPNVKMAPPRSRPTGFPTKCLTAGYHRMVIGGHDEDNIVWVCKICGNMNFQPKE